MPPKKGTNARRVIGPPLEASDVQQQLPTESALTSSPQKSSLSSPSPAAAVAVSAIAPNRRVTRSQARLGTLATSAGQAAVGGPPRTRAPKSREADSSDKLSADTRAVPKTSNIDKPAVSPEQTSRPPAEQSLLAQRNRTDPVQPIRSWAVGIEGRPTSQASPYNSSAPDTDGFWKQHGYDLPDTSTASMSSKDDNAAASRSRGTSSNRKAKSEKTATPVTTVSANERKFPAVLMDHNINFNAELIPDEKLDEMKKLVLRNYWRNNTTPDTDLPGSQEAKWRRDMTKCKISNEAIFQRTIMMDIIERDELNGKLDYMCEAAWCADRMPGRDENVKLAHPKPDLTVAFKTASLLPEYSTLPSLMRLGKITGHIFAEGLKKGDIDRTFHFFAIEVKGKRGQIGNTEAEYQNLNTAAQALHNIYIVMKEAKLEEDFFSQVRFFSVVATTASFEVRVHRAIRLDEDDYIDPEYGIGFSYDEIEGVPADYTKAAASTIVYNILYDYGVKTLHPILKRALEVVLKKHRGAGKGERAKGQGRSGEKVVYAAQQDSPPKGKRRGEDDIAESFGSNARRRLESLEMNVQGENGGELLRSGSII